MTNSANDELYYDPWRADLNPDPYPMFKRFRDEAPLYYNADHDFYALSRFDDVNRTLVDPRRRIPRYDRAARQRDLGAGGCGKSRRTPIRLRRRVFRRRPCAAPTPDIRYRRALLPWHRFPDWEIDLDEAVFSSASAVRGWDSMPARV